MEQNKGYPHSSSTKHLNFTILQGVLYLINLLKLLPGLQDWFKKTLILISCYILLGSSLDPWPFIFMFFVKLWDRVHAHSLNFVLCEIIHGNSLFMKFSSTVTCKPIRCIWDVFMVIPAKGLLKFIKFLKLKVILTKF